MGLVDRIDFKNVSKVEQSIFSTRGNCFVRAKPGEILKGSEYRGIQRMKCFQETVENVWYNDLVPLVREENDLELLKRLLISEAQGKKREQVAKILTSRIKKLVAGVAKDESNPNSGASAQPNRAA